LSIGPGWSSLCKAPFRQHKTWVHEGGIHTPFLGHQPAGFGRIGKHARQKVPRGRTRPYVHHRDAQLGRAPGERIIRPRHNAVVPVRLAPLLLQGVVSELLGDRSPVPLYCVQLDAGENLRVPLERPLEVQYQRDAAGCSVHATAFLGSLLFSRKTIIAQGIIVRWTIWGG